MNTNDFYPSTGRAEPGLQGRRVLLVEDSAIVAMEAQMILEEEGMEVVGPASGIEQAASLLQEESVDMAFLDIDLNGRFVWPIAETLADRKIPFAFATGYESASTMPHRFCNNLILQKPYRSQELVKMAHRLTELPNIFPV